MDSCLGVCGLIKSAASCCDRRMNAALDNVSVSHCQAQVLMQVSAHGSISMTALSKQLCCHKSNITQIVDVLVDRDLIERVPSKEDKRMFTLKLKPKGKKMLLTAEKALCKQAHECLNVFTPNEREQLQTLLKKYVDCNSAT
jgi:DNA-binding MarR family transcriptional regulator